MRSPDDLPRRAKRFIDAATATYGKHWQAEMARATGLSVSLLSMIKSGHRQVTSDAEAALLKVLESEKRRLQTDARRVSLWARQIKKDLK